MKPLLYIFLMAAFVANATVPVEEEGNRLHRKTPLTTEKQLHVDISSYSGNFYLFPEETNLAYRLSLKYEHTPPVVTYNRMGDRGYLSIKSKAYSKKDEENLDSREEEELDLKGQECELYLTPRVPLELKMKFGVVRGEMELGGLQLQRMEFSAGVSKLLVSFSAPNPLPLEIIRIQAGVGKLKMTRLGNANFRYLEFDGGIGTSLLDFSGNFRQQARLKFNVGIGKVTLRLPRTVGVRIKVNKSFFSSVDIDDVYKRDGYYYNDRWNNSDATMDIQINAGIGRVVIEWVD